MRINLMCRKVLYVFLSLAIVFANTQNAYAVATAGGWTITDTIIAGAETTIGAIKGAGNTALKSSIKVAPVASKVGKVLLRGGGAAALLIAVPQIIGDGVDWVMNPANNSVDYTKLQPVPNTGYSYSAQGKPGVNEADACQNYLKSLGLNSVNYKFTGVIPVDESNPYGNYGGVLGKSFTCQHNYHGNPMTVVGVRYGTSETVYENKIEQIPIATVADKVISNAAAGNAASQDVVKQAAIESAIAGDYDAEFESVATPSTDTSNPPTNPDDPSVPAFDPSSIIAAIKSLADIISARFSALTNALGLTNAKLDTVVTEQQDTKRVINEGMDKVVAANDRTGAKVGEVVTAIDGIGEKMDEGQIAQGVVINDAVDKVIANDNANAQAANDVISQSADKALEADAANTGAVTDAINESGVATQESIANQTNELTDVDPETGKRSLKLPAFCSFAGVVCDYIDWVKGEYASVSEFVKTEPEAMVDEPVLVADPTIGIFEDKAEAGYVSFESECPADVLIPVSLMGATQTLSLSYVPFCHFASMIRYAVILGAWISGLLIISGGRGRE